jgi:hypothetical protein
MSEPNSTWEIDFRWRRVRVSSHLLSAFLRGQLDAARIATVPPDLQVIGLVLVNPGPAGYYEFVVWSATFDPVPNNGKLPYEPFPLVDFEYSI